MKKLLHFLLIVFLFSCEKKREEPTCWECKIITTKTVTTYHKSAIISINSQITKPCDLNKTEIDLYEKIHSNTISVNSGGNTETTKSICKCN